MRYLITGGAGLIGAYVARQLAEAGDEVLIYDLAPDRDFLADLMPETAKAGIAVTSGNVTDLAELLRATRSAKPDVIIHLAALLAAASNDNPLRSLDVNCKGALNVFEAALDQGVKRVVWASSVAVFGQANKRPPGAVDNEAAHTPTDLYGATKSLNERFSKHYRRAYGLDCVGLRYTAVYGYGKSRTLARGTGTPFMGELIDKPATGRPGVVPAGDAVVDFLHAEDAARATILAARHPGPIKPVALNIGGDRASLRDAAAAVRRIIPEADLTVEDGSWKSTVHHYDISAAKEAIGYEPAFDIERGFAENIDQVRRRL